MSEDIIRIEAFIKIDAQYENVTYVKRCCSKGHLGLSSNKYCSECGVEIIEKSFQNRQVISIYDLIENENLQQYFIDDDMYIFSNRSRRQLDINDNILTEITPVLIEEEINTFKENHKDDIELLEEKVGNIKVRFGFLKYRW